MLDYIFNWIALPSWVDMRCITEQNRSFCDATGASEVYALSNNCISAAHWVMHPSDYINANDAHLKFLLCVYILRLMPHLSWNYSSSPDFISAIFIDTLQEKFHELPRGKTRCACDTSRGVKIIKLSHASWLVSYLVCTTLLFIHLEWLCGASNLFVIN